MLVKAHPIDQRNTVEEAEFWGKYIGEQDFVNAEYLAAPPHFPKKRLD